MKLSSRVKKEIIEWITSIIWAFVIVFPIRYFFIDVVRVQPSGTIWNNKPTISEGSIILVNKAYYLIIAPMRGDLVWINNKGVNLINRIVGLPGENIKIEDGITICNGIRLNENYSSNFGHPYKGIFFEKKLSKNEYFVIGDNRSKDAFNNNYFSYTVQRGQIVGRLFFCCTFFSKNGIIKIKILNRPQYNIANEEVWLYNLPGSKYHILFKL